MPSRDAGKWVIWPHYFDRNLTRAKGRRVPAEMAIDEPKAGHVANAARTLGLKVELDEDAKPPSNWYMRKGCVLVAKSADKKEEVLKAIARRL